MSIRIGECELHHIIQYEENMSEKVIRDIFIIHVDYLEACA